MGGNGYVYGLDGGDAFMGVFLSIKFVQLFYMSVTPQKSGKIITATTKMPPIFHFSVLKVKRLQMLN